MPTPPFLDTNILVYANSSDARHIIAVELVTSPFTISVQILNEFANVMSRKWKMPWVDVEEAVTDILLTAHFIHPVSLETHLRALQIVQRHQFQFYDAVMIASALFAGCETLFSEDMHDGMVIENRLTIRNPFA